MSISRTEVEQSWGRGQTVTGVDGNPVGKLAPCRPDGEVKEVNEATKAAICRCALNPGGCNVSGRNLIVGLVRL